jgi:hypothetical protein
MSFALSPVDTGSDSQDVTGPKEVLEMRQTQIRRPARETVVRDVDLRTPSGRALSF